MTYEFCLLMMNMFLGLSIFYHLYKLYAIYPLYFL